MDFEAFDVAREFRQAAGEKSAAGADLEHALAAHRHERLQRAAFDRRFQHGLAMADRDRRIRERDAAVGLGHEVLARHGGERVEHARFQHVPGAHLLFDHLPAGSFNSRVHGHYGESRKGSVQA